MHIKTFLGSKHPFPYIWLKPKFKMKKKLFTLGLVAMFGLGLASCNKCVTCGDCADGVEIEGDGEICEDDFDSKEDYDASVSLLESSLFGCTCD
jgi:hypothetical protein